MSKTLLEQLPEIVANGRKEAERILESLEGRHRVSLQTREMVFPAKDVAQADLLSQPVGRVSESVTRQRTPTAVGLRDEAANPTYTSDASWNNRLIYGDNLLAMAALLAGDEHTPSLRGKVDLIYIDPPFDSKADYRTKVVLPSPAGGRGAGGEGKSVELEQKPTVIEQFAYSDTWSDGTASYLAMIVPRLVLMRELLSDTGSIYVHLDWHVGHYVKIAMDEIFGRENFRNEIVWRKLTSAKAQSKFFSNVKDSIFCFSKSYQVYFEGQYIQSSADSSTYSHIEELTGRRYGSFDFTQAGRGDGKWFGQKFLEPPSGKHWIWSQEKINDGIEKAMSQLCVESVFCSKD